MLKLKQQVIVQIQKAIVQAKSNTRLRISLWIILFISISYPWLVLNDYNQSLRDNIKSELDRESKILRTAGETEWFQRAEKLTKLNGEIEQLFWDAPSTGIAKATLFQTLNEWAQKNKLTKVQIRLEEPTTVEGQEGIYRVAGQIDTVFEAKQSMEFLSTIEKSDLKIVIEQMEISQRTRPVHRLIIATYFRVET
jgi:hypothetical protein